MKISHAWLQTYFEKPLPSAEELAELLTFHSFEIEGVERVCDDSVIDVDVLSNRSSDCLSHRGIAKELAVLLSRTDEFNARDPLAESAEITEGGDIHIRIDALELVERFSIARIEGVKVGPSPAWLKACLEVIGQRSINNIVDATNYVMFSLGQPLHAFDAEKLSGEKKTLAVRLAQANEKITTLTNDTYELDATNLLIVDGESNAPLAIAGVKGGKHAELSEGTTDIIIEAANFSPVSVRKTSRALKLQTDASVRFQNEPVANLTAYALREVVLLIQSIAGGEKAGSADWYPHPRTEDAVSVSLSDITNSLGAELSVDEVSDILSRFGFRYEITGEVFTVTPPFERTDLVYKEDLIEEIGRVFGYQHISSKTLEEGKTSVSIHEEYALARSVRETLLHFGFSEVLTYQLRDTGELALKNSLASDKNHLRDTLTHGVKESLEKNTYHAPLLGLSEVKIFEIGVVYKEKKERLTLSLGVRLTKKKKGITEENVIKDALNGLALILPGVENHKITNGVVEILFDEYTQSAQTPKEYPHTNVSRGVLYKPFSSYPFVLRDIAFWTQEGSEKTEQTFSESITREAGELLSRIDLFDRFEKEGRVSYAYHLVFQAPDRTLTDEEVNAIMARVESMLKGEGCEAR